jgi:hypothetical protein
MNRVNVRIANTVEVGSSWFVEPGDTAKIEYVKSTLAVFQTEEPSANWKLQTRGDFGDWHDWKEPTITYAARLWPDLSI